MRISLLLFLSIVMIALPAIASPIYQPRSEVSSINSTANPLEAGATYTGGWQEASDFNSVVVAAATDQDGRIVVEFSTDRVNVDSALTRYYRTAQIEPPHRFTITRRYFRVKVINDSASDQTYLRLQTIYGDKANLNIPVDAAMSQDYDALSVRPTEFGEEVALGRRQGWSTWNKFGYNEGVGTSAEVIAAFGGAFNQQLAAGETLSIVSSSANDDADPAGTGVNSLIIFGVDSNWDLVTEVVQLNGTTPVTTTNSFLGVNRMTIFNSGSANSNVGAITATASSSGNTMATMPAGEGTTQQCIFYVPENYQFLATWLRLSAIKASGGGNPSIEFKGFVYSDVVQSEFEVFREDVDTQIDENIDVNSEEPFVIGEKSILWFEATGSAASTSVKCRFSGKLVRDVDF